MQPPLLSIKDFAAKIKAKYQQYADIDDTELAQKIIAKYPDYKRQIDMSEFSSKKKDFSLAPTQQQKEQLPYLYGGQKTSQNGYADFTMQKSKSEVQSESGLKIDDKDPVKSILTPLRDKYNLAQKDYDPYRNRMVADATVNKVLPTQLVNQNANEVGNKRIAEKQSLYAVNIAHNEIKKQLDDVKVARQALNTIKEKHGGVVPKDNETAQMANESVRGYDNLSKEIINSNSLEDAAIKEELQSNPSFANHYKILKGNIPNSMKGRIVESFVNRHGVNLQNFTEEHPEYKDELDNITTKFADKYPETTAANIGNEISQAYEKKYSKAIEFNTSGFNEDVDNIAKELYANDPQKLVLYDKLVKNNKGEYFKSAAPLTVLGKSMVGGVKEFGKTIGDLTGARTAEDRSYEALDQEGKYVTANPKGIRDIMNESADFGGKIIDLAAAGNLMTGLGANAIAANSVPTILQFHDENLKQAQGRFGDSWKAKLSADVATAMYAFLPNAIPAGKIRGAIDNVIKDVSEKASVSSVRARITSALGEAVKQYGKGAGEMTGMTAIQQVVDKALGAPHDNASDELAQSFEGMLKGNILPALAHGLGKYAGMKVEPKDELKSAIDELPEGTYTSALKQADEPTRQEYLKNIAEQLNSSETEAATTRKVFGDKISDIALKLYPDAKPAGTTTELRGTEEGNKETIPTTVGEVGNGLASSTSGNEKTVGDKESVEPIKETFENKTQLEDNLDNTYKGQKNVVYHGSPDISYLKDVSDLNTKDNTQNAESKYVWVNPKSKYALNYSKSHDGFHENSGVAAFELNKGKKYVLKKSDIVDLKTNDDYEKFFDKKKEEGYDYVEVPQDGGNIVILNNDVLKFKGKHLNREVLNPKEQPSNITNTEQEVKKERFYPDDKVILKTKDGKEVEVNFRGYVNDKKAVVSGKKFGQMEVDVEQLRSRNENDPLSTQERKDLVSKIDWGKTEYNGKGVDINSLSDKELKDLYNQHPIWSKLSQKEKDHFNQITIANTPLDEYIYNEYGGEERSIIDRLTKEHQDAVEYAKSKNLYKPTNTEQPNENTIPTEEAKPKIKGLYEKAADIPEGDLVSPRERVLQHFANDGKIHTSAIQEVFGGGDKSINGERNSRIGIIRKDAPTIEQLSHQLWESDPSGKYNTSDYKNAIEQVLQDHISRASAAKELIGVREAAKHELSKEEASNVDDRQLEQLHNIVKGLPDNQKQELIKLLESYQNEYGLVDWDKLEKDSNGFEPKILNLTEETQKSLYDLIEKNVAESGSESANANGENILQAKEQKTADQSIGNGEPPTPPEQKAVSGVYVERPATELSHRGLQDVANEFSLPDVESRDTKTDVQLRQDAENTINDWKEKGEYGKKVEGLVDKAENNGILTDEERVIMEQHLANVIGSARELDRNSKEYNDKLKEIKRLKDAGEKTRSAAGAALRIPSNSGSVPRTIEDAMVDRMNASNVEELTPEQKADVEAKFSEYEKNAKQADDKIAELQQKNAELQAELELQRQKKSTQKNTKKDFKSERQDIRNSIKEKWAKAANDNTLTAVPLPYAKQLVAIAPDVAKLMKSYVEEGVVTFSEMIDKLHEDVRGVIPEIKREDVIDMVAGKYDEPKETKGDLMDRLKKIKDKNSAEAIKIKSKIASGDFAKPQKPKGIFDSEELKKKHPQLYKETLDAVRRKEDAQHELALANLKAEIANRTKGQKLAAIGGKVLRTAKALKAGIDFSATLVQNLLAIMAHPVTGVKSIGESFKDFASADRFERELARLHNSEWWPLIEQSGLSVVDPKSLRENEKNDIFNDTYFDDMKIKGKSIAPTKPFERQFTSLGNAIRLNLFLRKAEGLYEQGKTFETHPEDFKSVAATINNMTGRGTMTKSLENHNELLSSILWSPRLLASTLNVLGIGDAALAFKGEKGFYRSLTPSQRGYAIKEISKGIGMGIAVMAAIAYATGGKADLNPTSATFGTVENGDYRWTVFGRFTSVVRMLAMLLWHEKTTPNKGTQELDASKNGATTLNESWKFIRGKMNPSLAFGVDIVGRQMYSGARPTVKKELENMLYPMSVSDIVAGIKQDGMKGLLIRGIPSTFGAKVSNENDFIQQNTFEQKAIINGENRVMTDDEFKNFAKKKQEILDAAIEKFKQKGAYVVEGNQPVYKSFNQMTMEQKTNKINALSIDATKKAKEQLFGKQQEKKEKEKADKKAKELNDKLYK